MSPLHCNTLREALYDRAASSGPEPLTPALADHLATCPACRAEQRAVRDLVETSRAITDPDPPDAIWDGFVEELDERLDAVDDGRRTFGWRRLNGFCCPPTNIIRSPVMKNS